MCIVCRGRLPKDELLRLQYKNQEIINFTYDARSFYLCFKCVDSLPKVTNRIKKIFKQDNIKLNFTINKELMP